MKRYLGFVKKEFLHIFRDVRTLLILFGIPAAQIAIFGYAVSTDIKDAGIAILDLSGDEITRDITGRLTASDFFVITEQLQSYNDIERVFREGVIREVMVFEEDFSRRLMSEGEASLLLIADGSEPNSAGIVAEYTMAVLNRFNAEQVQSPGSVSPMVNAEVKMYYNPELRSQYMFVPGVITIVLLLICALMTSITITREKEFGTMEALLVSPLKPAHIILGKVTPYFILSMIVMVVILTLSRILFGLRVEGSLVLLALETMLYILLSLSLGIVISTLSGTMQQAMIISLVGLMLPAVILSGFIFPVEYMPEIYNYISAIIPARWFITIIKTVMIKGAGFRYIWTETLILAGMTALFIFISIKQFRTRLE
jgi:ABC-2 type transport system permease protein